MTETERKQLKELVRKHYPELYVKNYGVDKEVAPELTQKRIKGEAKSLGIRHFNSMTHDERVAAIEAKRKGDTTKLQSLTEAGAKRFKKGNLFKRLKSEGQ
jgi:phage/plasmid primase-like uncharacterized protein